MICKQCGKEQAQGVKFCANCGAPMEGGQGAPEAVEKEPILTGKGKGSLVLLAMGAVVVIAAVVLLVKLLGGLGGGGAKPMVAFRNDDGELMFRGSLKEKAEAVEVENTGAYGVRFSDDGKWLYYQEGGSLYAVKTPVTAKSEPQRIARDADHFWLMDSGKVVIRDRDGDYQLYEGKDTVSLLDHEDGSVERLREDSESLYYSKADSKGRYTLYKKDIKKDAKATVVLEDYFELYSACDADVLVYAGKRDSETGTVDVYACKAGEKGAKLVENAQRVWVAADNKAEFYYTVTNEAQANLYDLVDDDMRDEDQATLRGEEPKEPDPADYEIMECGPVNDREGYYITEKGNRYTFDWDQEIYMDPLDAGWANVRERRAADREAMREVREKWEQAQRREEVRKTLKESSYGKTTVDLYLYSGKVSQTPVASGVRDWEMDIVKEGVLFYRKEKQRSLEKVARMSELDLYNAGYDIKSRADDGDSRDDTWYVYVGGKESELEVRDRAAMEGMYVLEGKEVVLDLYESDQRVLRAFSLQGAALEELGVLSHGDYRVFQRDGADADKSLYFYEREGSADFMCYTVGGQGRAQTVAGDVGGRAYLVEDGSIYVFTGHKDLAVVKKGEVQEVVDDVGYDVSFLDGGKLLYIGDNGDLMYYNGKKSIRLEKDVEWYVPSAVTLDYTSCQRD